MTPVKGVPAEFLEKCPELIPLCEAVIEKTISPEEVEIKM